MSIHLCLQKEPKVCCSQIARGEAVVSVDSLLAQFSLWYDELFCLIDFPKVTVLCSQSEKPLQCFSKHNEVNCEVQLCWCMFYISIFFWLFSLLLCWNWFVQLLRLIPLCPCRCSQPSPAYLFDFRIRINKVLWFWNWTSTQLDLIWRWD